MIFSSLPLSFHSTGENEKTAKAPKSPKNEIFNMRGCL